MLLLQRKFRWRGSCWEGIPGKAKIFEHEEVSELFDIPAGVGAVWVSLHDRSSKDRYRAKIVEDNDPYEKYPVIKFDAGGVYEHARCDKTLKRFIGKVVYIQVEYME